MAISRRPPATHSQWPNALKGSLPFYGAGGVQSANQRRWWSRIAGVNVGSGANLYKAIVDNRS